MYILLKNVEGVEMKEMKSKRPNADLERYI